MIYFYPEERGNRGKNEKYSVGDRKELVKRNVIAVYYWKFRCREILFCI